jgi:hypothetical protein
LLRIVISESYNPMLHSTFKQKLPSTNDRGSESEAKIAIRLQRILSQNPAIHLFVNMHWYTSTLEASGNWKTAEIAWEKLLPISLWAQEASQHSVQLWLVGENKNPELSQASPCHVLLDISEISDYQMLTDGWVSRGKSSFFELRCILLNLLAESLRF